MSYNSEMLKAMAKLQEKLNSSNGVIKNNTDNYIPKEPKPYKVDLTKKPITIYTKDETTGELYPNRNMRSYLYNPIVNNKPFEQIKIVYKGQNTEPAISNDYVEGTLHMEDMKPTTIELNKEQAEKLVQILEQCEKDNPLPDYPIYRNLDVLPRVTANSMAHLYEEKSYSRSAERSMREAKQKSFFYRFKCKLAKIKDKIQYKIWPKIEINCLAFIGAIIKRFGG